MVKKLVKKSGRKASKTLKKSWTSFMEDPLRKNLEIFDLKGMYKIIIDIQRKHCLIFDDAAEIHFRYIMDHSK